MPYLVEKKFHINWSDLLPREQVRVLIAEPEYNLARLYAKILIEEQFWVQTAANYQELEELAFKYYPDICVVNPETTKGVAAVLKILQNLSIVLPSAIFITVAFDLPPDHIKQLMKAGVSSHLDRRLSKPKDLVEILKLFRQSINKNNKIKT